jgi:hypothetical protein
MSKFICACKFESDTEEAFMDHPCEHPGVLGPDEFDPKNVRVWIRGDKLAALERVADATGEALDLMEHGRENDAYQLLVNARAELNRHTTEDK